MNGGRERGATPSELVNLDRRRRHCGQRGAAGRATFGVFGGEPKQIYTREIY